MWRLQDGMAGRRQTIRSPLIAGYEEQVELLAGGRHSRAAALYSTHNFGSGGRTTWVTASVAASPAHRRPVRAGDRGVRRPWPCVLGSWPAGRGSSSRGRCVMSSERDESSMFDERAL